ncbi:hypothetical protein MASR2M78_10620 [Treponema sp.]
MVDEKDLDPEKRDDWLEVNNYVKALNEALDGLKTLPLSYRLIRNAHKILLSGAKETRRTAGANRSAASLDVQCLFLLFTRNYLNYCLILKYS